MYRRFSTLILTATALSLTAPAFAQTASPETVVTVAASPIDYSFYDGFMEKVSVKQGGRPRLAYDVIRKQKENFVGDYISRLAQEDVSALPENDQLAYWLNVQNIVTVQAIIQDGKGKKSLKKLRGTGEAPGKLWTIPRVTVAGQDMSLQDIEAKLLTDFDNPNIIYGIYQGVRGAPCLMPTAYRGASVEETLAKNAKQYVNSNGIVTVINNTVEVTPVFLWYQDDVFEGDDKLLLEHLKANAEPKLKNTLYRGRSFQAADLNYRLDTYKPEKGSKQGARGGGRKPSRSSGGTSRPAPSGGGYGS